MTAVYYVMDGDGLLVSTMAARAKAKAVAQNPKVPSASSTSSGRRPTSWYTGTRRSSRTSTPPPRGRAMASATVLLMRETQSGQSCKGLCRAIAAKSRSEVRITAPATMQV